MGDPANLVLKIPFLLQQNKQDIASVYGPFSQHMSSNESESVLSRTKTILETTEPKLIDYVKYGKILLITSFIFFFIYNVTISSRNVYSSASWGVLVIIFVVSVITMKYGMRRLSGLSIAKRNLYEKNVKDAINTYIISLNTDLQYPNLNNQFLFTFIFPYDQPGSNNGIKKGCIQITFNSQENNINPANNNNVQQQIQQQVSFNLPNQNVVGLSSEGQFNNKQFESAEGAQFMMQSMGNIENNNNNYNQEFQPGSPQMEMELPPPPAYEEFQPSAPDEPPAYFV